MRTLQKFCELFEGSYAAQTIAQVEEVYADLQKGSDAFIEKYSIHCPAGCGTCCEHFLPDITEAEALEVAVYLVFIKKDYELIEKIRNTSSRTQPPCPLYNPDSPYHCTVYQARPLICRLFGACASSDKNGTPVFRKCKYNCTDSMPQSLSITDSRPAEMEDFSVRINSISPNPTVFLPEAVSLAIDKIQFLAGAIGYIGSDDDDTPSPTPIAS
ncbi:MAG: YkgJ family cysteine cluster protein [Sphaerochaetaceae bacterium]|nr:YkgJ family cysteine cluster protein [Sphaerochaetaceae bacterium]